jgi:cytochrome c-type biogenesis protein CcmH
MLGEIGRLTASGQTPQQIKTTFIAQYGEAVLSAPIRRGFNLVAWWGPYAAIAAGAVALVALGMAWSRRSRQQVGTGVGVLSPEERALLERELEAFRD